MARSHHVRFTPDCVAKPTAPSVGLGVSEWGALIARPPSGGSVADIFDELGLRSAGGWRHRRRSSDILGELSQVLGGGDEQNLVAGAAQAPQPQPVELLDALPQRRWKADIPAHSNRGIVRCRRFNELLVLHLSLSPRSRLWLREPRLPPPRSMPMSAPASTSSSVRRRARASSPTMPPGSWCSPQWSRRDLELVVNMARARFSSAAGRSGTIIWSRRRSASNWARKPEPSSSCS